MVLVDSNILTHTFRRPTSNPAVRAHALHLIDNDHMYLIGAIRQESLSGITSTLLQQTLRSALDGLHYAPTLPDDHDLAAYYYTRCRQSGIQGHHHDFLLCAVSTRLSLPIWTTDHDFQNFSGLIPVNLYSMPSNQR